MNEEDWNSNKATEKFRKMGCVCISFSKAIFTPSKFKIVFEFFSANNVSGFDKPRVKIHLRNLNQEEGDFLLKVDPNHCIVQWQLINTTIQKEGWSIHEGMPKFKQDNLKYVIAIFKLQNKLWILIYCISRLNYISSL